MPSRTDGAWHGVSKAGVADGDEEEAEVVVGASVVASACLPCVVRARFTGRFEMVFLPVV